MRLTDYIRGGIIIIMGIFALIVVIQNTESMPVKLVFTTVTMPRALLLFLTLGIGFLVGIMASYFWRRRRFR